MKIKFSTTNKLNQQEQNLWRDSPCSYNYTLQNPSMDNAPKFQRGSIYYRDLVDKPKKVFTDFQKPDLLLLDFRRQIEQASHPKYNTSTKKANQQKKKEKIRSNSLTSTAYSKLYQVPQKNDYKYDKFGVRSNYVGDYNVKEIQISIRNKKKNFTSGRRIDLNKPHNFYPGPGTYNPNNPHMKEWQQVAKRRTFSDFGKVDSNELNRIQTLRNWKQRR